MWALGFLRRRRGRVLLTVLGVALSVGLTTTMLSIAAGLDTTSARVIEGTGVDLLVLDSGSPVFGAARHLPFDNGTQLADEFAGDPRVRTAFPILERTVTVFPGSFAACQPACPAVNPVAEGEDPGRRGGLGGLDMTSGVYFENSTGDPFALTPEFRGRLYPAGFNSTQFTREILLNEIMARELEAAVGDTVFVSATRDFNGSQAFRVVGVYEASFETDQSRNVRMHLSELQYLTHRTRGEVTLIALDLHDAAREAEVASWVEASHPALKASSPSEILGELDQTTSAFKVFAGLIAVVSIGVAVLFSATVFMISARERVGEIAALRAIGISRATIFREMLFESGVLGGLGLALGLAIGALGAWSIDYVLKATTARVPHGMDVTAVTPEVVLVVGATSVLIGIAAGLVPALWATRLTIASAIRNL
ncbi:MAG TPA: FtsX-like permease family protein [Candidatus Thermoplasmatota archaeon]|nr:FtsX-like permease family protein [Candidatus Thermoplasmatota archaeon]